MNQRDFMDILTRFRHGQCPPADMDTLLNVLSQTIAMMEAPPEGYCTWRMYRLAKEGIIKHDHSRTI